MKKIIIYFILNKIKKHFGFLKERGFRIIYVDYYSKHFGNWKAGFESDCLLIEIYKDRGDISLVLSPVDQEKNYRIGIRPMIYFISNGEKFIGWINGKEDYQLSQLSNLLLEYFDEIKPYFSENFENYKDEMKKAQDTYNRKLVP